MICVVISLEVTWITTRNVYKIIKIKLQHKIGGSQRNYLRACGPPIFTSPIFFCHNFISFLSRQLWSRVIICVWDSCGFRLFSMNTFAKFPLVPLSLKMCKYSPGLNFLCARLGSKKYFLPYNLTFCSWKLCWSTKLCPERTFSQHFHAVAASKLKYFFSMISSVFAYTLKWYERRTDWSRFFSISQINRWVKRIRKMLIKCGKGGEKIKLINEEYFNNRPVPISNKIKLEIFVERVNLIVTLIKDRHASVIRYNKEPNVRGKIRHN